MISIAAANAIFACIIAGLILVLGFVFFFDYPWGDDDT